MGVFEKGESALCSGGAEGCGSGESACRKWIVSARGSRHQFWGILRNNSTPLISPHKMLTDTVHLMHELKTLWIKSAQNGMAPDNALKRTEVR